MHEYSIAEALLERVEAEARGRRALAVRGLSVRIGALSGIEPALLATAYDVLREGTPCANAPLEIEVVPARWECPSCGGTIPPGAPLRCAACATAARLAQGGEVLLQRVDLEVP